MVFDLGQVFKPLFASDRVIKVIVIMPKSQGCYSIIEYDDDGSDVGDHKRLGFKEGWSELIEGTCWTVMIAYILQWGLTGCFIEKKI